MTAQPLQHMLLESARLTQNIQREYARVKKDHRAKYFTYVLQLTHGKFYVGNTDNIYARILDHVTMSDSTAKWVKLHGPVQRVVEVARNCAIDDETYKTLEYMVKFGWQNVRGSSYCKVDLHSAPKALDTFQRTRDGEFEYLTPQELRAVMEEVQRLKSSHDTPAAD